MCPSCGHVYTRSKEVLHVPGTLAEVKRGRPGPTDGEKAAFFGQLRYIASEKAYKPGWAAIKYKEKFQEWPADSNEPPVEATPEVLSWVKSRQIAFAKAKRA